MLCIFIETLKKKVFIYFRNFEQINIVSAVKITDSNYIFKYCKVGYLSWLHLLNGAGLFVDLVDLISYYYKVINNPKLVGK